MSGHTQDVEEMVSVLMRMNITTRELRKAAARAGPLGDASKYSYSLLVGSLIFWVGSPFLMALYHIERLALHW